MKKAFTLFTLGAALLTLAGCGSSQPVSVVAPPPTTATTPTTSPQTVHSLEDYISVELTTVQPRQQLGTNTMAEIFRVSKSSPCDPAYDEFCDPVSKKDTVDYIFYSDPQWRDGNTHDFYIEVDTEGPPYYYGPFHDNTKILSEQVK